MKVFNEKLVLVRLVDNDRGGIAVTSTGDSPAEIALSMCNVWVQISDTDGLTWAIYHENCQTIAEAMSLVAVIIKNNVEFDFYDNGGDHS